MDRVPLGYCFFSSGLCTSIKIQTSVPTPQPYCHHESSLFTRLGGWKQDLGRLQYTVPFNDMFHHNLP